ncbi:hypothetical protein G6F29_012385 [Rhizopus arrhizus]|nr:hypothetical protein G6F29_012385 [Rhizopus arrhizus]
MTYEGPGVNYIDDWPAQSPDLNPIEHLWHHLKLKLSLYDKKAKGVHELWERVEKEWNSFDKEACRRYIDTMPARIKASFFTHCKYQISHRQYTKEQLFSLFEQWSLQYRPQQDDDDTEFHLPVDIADILETTPASQLKESFRKFKMGLRKYRHEEWTTSEEINKQFIPKLKKHTMDTLQVVNTIYKHSKNTRTMARAVTELYEQIQYLQTSASTINPMELAKIQSECREAAKRLVVYGWASARTQDNQATEFAAKAIKVPYNVAMDYLPEEGTKRQAFSKEFVREYNQVSHQNALNRAAVNNKPTGTDSRYGGRGRATETTSLQQSSKAIDLQHSIQNNNSNNNYSIPSDGIQPGGRLNKFYNNWIKVISHKWPLSVIREGYKIQLNSNPIPWKLKKMNLKLEDQIAVDQAVEKFMTAGIIEISPNQSRDYLSNFFTIQEATKRRPILDCKMINNYIQCHHFKMPMWLCHCTKTPANILHFYTRTLYTNTKLWLLE